MAGLSRLSNLEEELENAEGLDDDQLVNKTLEKLASLCPCVARLLERRRRKARREVAIRGAEFERKMFTMGFQTGTQRVKVRVQRSGDACEWWSLKEPSRFRGAIDLVSVSRCAVADNGTSLTLEGSNSDKLLQLVGASSDDVAQFATALQESVEDARTNAPGGVKAGGAAASLKSTADQAAHYVQREIDIRTRKEAASKKKAKLMQSMKGGGMKYTAIAMCERS